jgi:hypothetical protein
MRKTFCDKCGAECVHSVFRCTFQVTHFTTANGGNQEEIGEDEFPWVDLCHDCGEEVQAFLGDALKEPRHYERDQPAVERMALDEIRVAPSP